MMVPNSCGKRSVLLFHTRDDQSQCHLVRGLGFQAIRCQQESIACDPEDVQGACRLFGLVVADAALTFPEASWWQTRQTGHGGFMAHLLVERGGVCIAERYVGHEHGK